MKICADNCQQEKGEKMRIELRNRQSGKTNDMLLRAHGTKNVIVCINFTEVKRLKMVAKELELDIMEPVTFGEFINGNPRAVDFEGYYIDNADMLLQQLARVPLKLVTMSN